MFIVGDTIKVVRRFSLPNVGEEELSKATGVFRFPRVSCSAATADDAELDPGVSGELTGESFNYAKYLITLII